MTIAVVTGAHPIEIREFQDAVREAAPSQCYFQSLYEWGTDSAEARASYDAVVFYQWHLDTPLAEPTAWWQKGTREAIEELGNGQGIVLLHHSIVAFPGWPTWDRLCGFGQRDFAYHQDQDVSVSIVDPANPITRGLSDFRIEDEVYLMDSPSPSDVVPVLTTDHPLSMRTIAWTHEVGTSRVFCFQLGHGHTSYGHEAFRSILGNGIRWAARMDEG